MKRLSILILVFFIFLANTYGQNTDSISKKAYKLYKNKEYQSAYLLYNKLLSKDSISDNDRYILGLICYKKGNLKKAISIFNRLSLKYKNDLNSRFWLANSIFRQDSSLKNIYTQKYFKDFVSKAEMDTFKYAKMLFYGYHYLSSYYSIGNNPNYESAIYYSNKMLTIAPAIKKNKIKGFLCLEFIYTRMKNDSMSKFYAKKVLELDPENSAANIILKSYNDKIQSNTIKSLEKSILLKSDRIINDDTIK
jgi:hypothetical protein